MKRMLLTAALIAVGSNAQARVDDVEVSVVAGTDQVVLRHEIELGQHVWSASYARVTDWFARTAGERCPDGWDKLGETVRREGAKHFMRWTLRCLPAEAQAAAPAK